MKKLTAAFLALILCFALVSCGGSGGNGSGSGSSADKVGEYYQFDIDGQEYALPCSITQFTDNGWYIEDEELNYELDANTMMSVFVYTNASDREEAFVLNAINMTDQKKKISECDVIGFSVGSSYACCNNRVTLKKSGVKIDVSSSEAALKTCEALKAAYGTDEPVYSSNDGDGTFGSHWSFSKMIPEDERSDEYVIGLDESTSIEGVTENADQYVNGVQFSLDYAGHVQ